MEDNNSNTEDRDQAVSIDTFTLWFAQTLKRWRIILVFMSIALLISILYGYIQETQEEAELGAWKATAEARIHKDREGLADRLEVVIQEHAGANALFYIEYELMQAYFDSNMPGKARNVAEKILRAFPGHPFAPQVRSDLGRLFEHEGSWEAARKEYEAVIASSMEYLHPEATLGRARCLEQANQREDAEAGYRRIIQQDWPERILASARLQLMSFASAKNSVIETNNTTEKASPVPVQN